ncbi:MAG TPA: DUF3187 family protein [Thermoanaerobaculia bacterium]|nr:DUF3187 family protein [Thermoanaerobaculia bacterium]
MSTRLQRRRCPVFSLDPDLIAGRSVLFVGVTENVASFNNTADIGLHLGLTTTFR